VLNRVNVSMIGMFTETSSYIPAWSEWVVSVGLVALGVLAVVFISENMPVRNEHHHHAPNNVANHLVVGLPQKGTD